MKPFFDEPFDLTDVATALLDDKFFLAAYVMCGQRNRWYVCVDQLERLFVEFLEAGIPDHKLYRLAALMWQWSKRLGPPPEPEKARIYFNEKLDFIVGGDRLDTQIRGLMRQRSDDVWEWAIRW